MKVQIEIAGKKFNVTGITSDSRQVSKGFAYVAVPGSAHDGHQFIGDVVSEGAKLIIGERDMALSGAIEYVRVPDARLALAELSSQFYGHPSHSLKVVGVTGTSGKTTTTYLVESILKAAGFEVGVIGTVNFRYGNKVYPSTHTTPGPVEIQNLLAQMKADGCHAVVMEVSSHALKQSRTAGIAFDAVAFTNLSRKHLDYHPDMEDYFRSKARLFTSAIEHSKKQGKSPSAAINAEDEYGAKLISELKPKTTGLKVFSFGLGPDPEVSGVSLKTDLGGIEGPVGDVHVDSYLTGKFNAQNILTAIAICQGMGIHASACSKGIKNLNSVPGRLQRVPNERGIHVMVDYAHKPDALEKVLQTLREIRNGCQLITVFGCGGDRDRSKRPVMGKLALELSDQVVVTSDNPRTEDPQKIIDEILVGMEGHPKAISHLRVQPDRRRAIGEAIGMAKPGDLVLIAGKGHEDYQIIGREKIHFDDREVAKDALSTL